MLFPLIQLYTDLFTWGMNHMYYTALITDSYTFTTLTTHALSQLTLEQVR